MGCGYGDRVGTQAGARRHNARMSGKNRVVHPNDPHASTGERRRRGVVVHDERGNARVEWVDAPHGGKRVSLSLQDDRPAAAPEQGYDPYANDVQPQPQPKAEGGQPRRAPRDLRKLSEWIKQVRRVEAQKRAERAEDGASEKKDS
jgi:hypothetical protein